MRLKHMKVFFLEITLFTKSLFYVILQYFEFNRIDAWRESLLLFIFKTTTGNVFCELIPPTKFDWKKNVFLELTYIELWRHHSIVFVSVLRATLHFLSDLLMEILLMNCFSGSQHIMVTTMGRGWEALKSCHASGFL